MTKMVAKMTIMVKNDQMVKNGKNDGQKWSKMAKMTKMVKNG